MEHFAFCQVDNGLKAKFELLALCQLGKVLKAKIQLLAFCQADKKLKITEDNTKHFANCQSDKVQNARKQLLAFCQVDKVLKAGWWMVAVVGCFLSSLKIGQSRSKDKSDLEFRPREEEERKFQDYFPQPQGGGSKETDSQIFILDFQTLFKLSR